MNRPELREGDILTRRYVLQERIATGGMSVIWRAFDQSLQRMVAIKVLDGSLDGDNPGRELIRREARATARLIHPDAIEVYDYGETVTNRGRLAAYVVMRLLEGRPLAERIEEGPLPWPDAIVIAGGLAKVLAAAHERGIVHRDVTPCNVLLAADGPKLLDFGIAAFTGEADDQLVADFGTPPYVAPERLQGLTADPAVDVYSLGVLLFEMLTGTPPYPETTWEGIEAARRDGPPPSPDSVPGLPPDVAALCRRCLSPDPSARPSAREFAAALSVETEPRGPRWLGSGAAAVGVIALGIVLWSQLASQNANGVNALTFPDVATPPAQRPAPVAVSPKAEPVGEPVPVATATVTVMPEQPLVTRSPAVVPVPLAKEGTMSLEAAVRQFRQLLRAGVTQGTTNYDTALDLNQVLQNAVANDDMRGVTSVHTKLDTRLREGRLTADLEEDLDATLDKVVAALTRANTT